MRAKGKFPFSDFMLIINQLEIAISIPVALNSTKTVSGFVDFTQCLPLAEASKQR